MPPSHRAKSAAFRRPYGAQPLADLVSPCIQPALARQGFGEADVLLHWPEIVGDQLAEHCRPVKLQWRPRTGGDEAKGAPEPATLVVRVEGAFALVLQHMAPVVLERVNVYFGWRCIGKMVLKQGPLPPASRGAKAKPVNDPEADARAARAAAGVEDDGLRAALVALGGKVLRKRAATRAVARPPFG